MDVTTLFATVGRTRACCIGGMNREQQSKDKSKDRAHRGRLAEWVNGKETVNHHWLCAPVGQPKDSNGARKNHQGDQQPDHQVR